MTWGVSEPNGHNVTPVNVGHSAGSCRRRAASRTCRCRTGFIFRVRSVRKSRKSAAALAFALWPRPRGMRSARQTRGARRAEGGGGWRQRCDLDSGTSLFPQASRAGVWVIVNFRVSTWPPGLPGAQNHVWLSYKNAECKTNK